MHVLETDDASDTDIAPTIEQDEHLKETIRNKLKSGNASKQSVSKSSDKEKSKKEPINGIQDEAVVDVSDSDSDDLKNELEKERRIKKKKKAYVY